MLGPRLLSTPQDFCDIAFSSAAPSLPTPGISLSITNLGMGVSWKVCVWMSLGCREQPPRWLLAGAVHRHQQWMVHVVHRGLRQRAAAVVAACARGHVGVVERRAHAGGGGLDALQQGGGALEGVERAALELHADIRT